MIVLISSSCNCMVVGSVLVRDRSVTQMRDHTVVRDTDSPALGGNRDDVDQKE